MTDTEASGAGVRISVFGPIEVTTLSRRIGASDFPSRKAKQLCELLICAEGRAVTKDRLVDVLWGDKLPQNPGATVDHTVSLLRRVLVADDGSQPIVNERGRYRIDLEVAEIDLFRFDALVDLAARETDRSSLEPLLHAADLAVGAVLADEPYASWAMSVRERYRQRVERVLLDIARRALVHDQLGLALRMAERARLESASVLEEAFALNVSTLMRMGNRHEARLLMVELEHRLKQEFGAELSPDSLILRTMLRRGAASPGGVEGLEVATRVIEPIDTLPFVGRERELAVVGDALRGSCEGGGALVIVEGAPGIGTTRFLSTVTGEVEHTVHSLDCLPSDADHPLLVATRLVRMLARHSGLPRAQVADGSASAVFDRMVDVVDALGPTIIVVDDLHWADPASLAVLAGLTQPGVASSLIVVAGRHVPDDDDGDLLAAAARAVVELGPLDRSIVDALPLESAWAETGGHPGLIAACVEADRRGGTLSAVAGGELLGWIDACGSPIRTMLGAAASLPQPVAIDQLAGRLGLSLPTIEELVEGAERRHLVRRIGPDKHTMEFRAALTRRLLQRADAFLTLTP